MLLECIFKGVDTPEASYIRWFEQAESVFIDLAVFLSTTGRLEMY